MADEIMQWPVNSRGRAVIFALLLAAITFFAYRPSWNGGFLWDDDDYIVKNDLLVAPDGLRRIWLSFDSPSQYFPLVYTIFRIERALWDLNPTGYHLVNLLLHIGNALLVWRLLLRLNVPGAWLAGAIFALHPVQVESVAWITERKNVLMAIFFLSSLLAWTRFVDQRSERRWLFYGLALAAYVLALFSKTTACTLPAAMVLILWLQKQPINWRRVTQIIPFIILGLAMGLVSVWWERYHQGTRGALFALGPIERILIASRAIWFYLGKLIWPSSLTFIYPQWTISPTHWPDYIWSLALVAAAGSIWLGRRYFGRSVEVAMAFYVATLAPVLGFIMLYTFRYTFVADHYQYLACIGPIALASTGVMRLGDVVKARRNVSVIISASIVISLLVLTWRQNTIYADIETLWRTTIARNPGCWMAHNNLGIVLAEKGQIDEAIIHYRKTLEMRPDYENADYNLGSALLAKGEIDAAITHCERAVVVRPQDPDAQLALANALLRKGSIDEAIGRYEKALALRPYFFAAHYNLSSALLAKGDADAAIAHCRAAMAIQPHHADTNINLGLALADKGQPGDAIRAYEKALAIAPESVVAQNNLGWLLATCADPAFRNGERALALAMQADRSTRHANPVVFQTMAAAYAEIGRYSEAVQLAEEASNLALQQGNNELEAAVREELSLYRAGRPYREHSR